MSDPLIVDIYPGDLGGKPALDKLIAAGPPWHGIILKASEGVYYPQKKEHIDWFNKYWAASKTLAGSRYGQDWFRGCYHYLRIDEDPIKQADLYLKTVENAGGWGSGDIYPIVDLEGAENPDKPSPKQMIDVTTAWANRVKSALGVEPILYGNNYIAEAGVKDHMGCELIWVARYSATLPDVIYKRIGWAADKLFGWQYCGDGESYLQGYPKICPMGATDITALTIAGGGANALTWMKTHLVPVKPAQ